VAERKSVLIRIDPVLHDSLQRWAAAEFRSLNAHVEFLLRRAVSEAGRGRTSLTEGGGTRGEEP